MVRAPLSMRRLSLITSTALALTGCHIQDDGAPPLPSTPCAQEGARAEGLRCEGGLWRVANEMSGPDAGLADMARDLSVPQDMPPSCQAESDAELCQNAKRCLIDLTLTDRCGQVRQVSCTDQCAEGASCDANTSVCVGVCVRTPCPSDLLCGRMSDGCGAMQLCDQCDVGSICDPAQSMCICQNTDPETLCGEQGLECGTAAISVCGTMTDVACGPCMTGSCVNNQCVNMERLTTPMLITAGERFGESAALAGDYLIVGAPRAQTTAARVSGRALLFERVQGRWTLAYDSLNARDIDLGDYRDTLLGASVAISSEGRALVGKRASGMAMIATTDQPLAMLARQRQEWKRAETFSGTGDDFGYATATYDRFIAASSTARNGLKRGSVVIHTLDPSTQQAIASRTYQGNERDEFGAAVALTKGQLLFGAPGTTSQTGSCHVALLESDEKTWGTRITISPFNGRPGDRFCEQVALIPSRFAASLSGRDDMATAEVGSVQLFSFSGTAWTHDVELFAPTPTPKSGFGGAIAFLSETQLAVSAPAASVAGLEAAGEVHLYERGAMGWRHVRTLVSPTPSSGGAFGTSLAGEAGLLVIGAPGEQDDSGAIYLYTP